MPITGPTSDTNSGKVLVGRLESHGATSLRPVSDLVSARLLGWRSDSSVLVTGMKEMPVDGGVTTDAADDHRIYAVDLDSGRAQVIGDVDDDLVDLDLQVAESLLGDPMVEGSKPPGLVAAFGGRVLSGVGLVAAGALGWFILRRRRRA